MEDYSNIILFDGMCNFCNSSVNFIIRRDKKNKFKFAHLQSETARKITDELNIPIQSFDSIILIKNKNYYTKFTAVINIFNEFSGIWRLIYVTKLLPVSVRDFPYDIIARIRYKWFGKKEECIIPSGNIREKFLK